MLDFLKLLGSRIWILIVIIAGGLLAAFITNKTKANSRRVQLKEKLDDTLIEEHKKDAEIAHKKVIESLKKAKEIEAKKITVVKSKSAADAAAKWNSTD
jgi:hypothetical protein